MDSNQQHKWLTAGGLAFWGTTIQTTFWFLGLTIILYVIYNFVDIAMSEIMPAIYSMSVDHLKDKMENIGASAMLCFFFSFLAYIFYLIGICLFKGAQLSPGSEMRARNIMLTELIMPALLILVCVVFYFNPEMIKDGTTVIFVLLLMWLGSLAAVIFLLLQFKALSKEETWSEKSRKGASDVKFSYSCLLWIQVIILVGLAILLWTTISFRSKLESMSLDMYLYGRLNSSADLIRDFKGTIKVEMVFISLLSLVFGALQTIYRIMGWRKIQTGGNEDVYTHTSPSAAPKRYSGSGRFCHKCGAALPEESAFCPGCGASVVVVASTEEFVEPEKDSSGEAGDNPESETIVEIEESFENEGSDNRKKWMLWGGIGAGVIVLGVVIWALCGKPKNIEPNEGVYDTAEAFVSDEEGCGGGDEELAYAVDEEDAECFDTAPYEDPYMEDDQEKERQFGGRIGMRGYINGKYEAIMEFTEYSDGSISGEYRYVKYNTPIVITGRYSDMVDYHEISIDEKVDGKVVGHFKGIYDGLVFSGTWMKADGSQEMPFRFER